MEYLEKYGYTPDEEKISAAIQAIAGNLFGDKPRHPRFDEFVGDYIAIAKSDMVLIYRERDECHYPGQHAGICDDEIYVPIIVAYKNKEAQVKQG